MKGIGDNDYEKAQQVSNTTEKKTLRCYHNTDLKNDVLLLVDLFETIENMSLEHYKLDPAHCLTAPVLA